MIRALIVATLLHAAAAAAASTPGDALRLLPARGGEDLPELPAATANDKWQLDVAESRTALAFGSARERWDAEIDYSHGLPPSMRLTHSLRLTDKLGAGARLQHGGGMSEVLLNAVYAYKRNVRLRFAAGQRKTASDFDDGPPVEQQSYLFSARKYWERRLWTDASVTVYTGEARNTADGLPQMLEDDSMAAVEVQPWRDDSSYSRIRGSALQVGFAPATYTRVELRHEFLRTSYYSGGHPAQDEADRISHFRFRQELRNCLLLSGGFKDGTGTRQLDLQLRDARWRIQLHRDFTHASAPSIWIGYSRAFDGAGSAAAECTRDQGQPRFEPMLTAAARRPHEFSYAPAPGPGD